MVCFKQLDLLTIPKVYQMHPISVSSWFSYTWKTQTLLVLIPFHL